MDKLFILSECMVFSFFNQFLQFLTGTVVTGTLVITVSQLLYKTDLYFVPSPVRPELAVQ